MIITRSTRTLHSLALSATALTPVDRLLRGALLMSLASSPLAAFAQNAPQQVTVDPSTTGAGQPRLDVAANGTPIVKIATPNDQGVSHNRYTDFNVDDRNLILNNSDRITQSLLGGYIDGNGNLKRSGSASLILNEVTGSNASLLRGYIEVAGAPAQLVLANANGIACEGCGFVNTPWVTLAAGTPLIDATGRVSGYRVGNGTLTVSGAGLDARDARLDLFARAIQLNAGVYAERVEGAFGAGDAAVDADGGITITGNPLAARPALGLDVAALGGMYARSIRLVGTEAGLGVRVEGTLASLDGGLTLDSKGVVTVGGTVTSGAAAAVTGTDISVAGTVYAEGPLTVAGQSVAVAGLTGSGSDLIVSASAIGGAGTYAAGLARDGTVSRAGTASLAATGALTLDGRVLARDAAAVSADTLSVSGGVQADAVSVVANATTVASGELRGTGSLDVTTGSLTNTGLLQGNRLTVVTGALVNAGGILDAGESASVTATEVDNTAGTIQSAGALALAAGELVNDRGLIAATGTGALTADVSGALSASGGTIGGNGDVLVNAASLNLAENAALAARGPLTVSSPGAIRLASGATAQAGGVSNLSAGTLEVNNARLQSGGALTVAADSVGIGADGVIGGGSLALTTGMLANSGRVLADGGGTVSIAGALNNAGLIQSNGGDLALSATALTNSGRIALAGPGALSLSSTTLSNSGEVVANGALGVNARDVANSGSLLAGGALTLSAVDVLRQDGRVAAGGALTATADRIEGVGGTYEAAGALSLNARTLALSGGGVVSTGDAGLSITATEALTASAARIGGNGTVTLTAPALNLGGSSVTALGSLTAAASAGDLSLGRGGLVAAGGPITLFATGTIDGSGASVESDALATLTAGRILLDDGLLQADRFVLDAPDLSLRRARLRQTGDADFLLRSSGTIDYSGSELFSGGKNFTIDAGSIVNRDGAILHGGTGTLSLSAANAIDNTGGRIATNGVLSLTAASLANSGGEITAAGPGAVTVLGAIDNTAGLLASGAGLTLNAGSLTNVAGSVESTGRADLALGSLTGDGGTILATGDEAALAIDVSGSVDGTGLIGSTGDVAISAAGLRLGAGDRVTSDGGVTLTMRGGTLDIAGTVDGAAVSLAARDGGLIVAPTGQVVTPGALTVNAGGATVSGLLQGGQVALAGDALTLTGGTIRSLGAARIDVAGAVANTGGEIAAGEGLTLTAGALANAGRITQSGGGPFALTIATFLDNSGGDIATNGALTIGTDALINSGGRIAAAGQLAVATAGLLDNRGGAVRGDADLAIAAGSLLNDTGAIDSLGGLSVTADQVDNGTGSLIARSGLGLALQAAEGRLLALTNGTGVIGSTGALSVSAGTITNAGSIAGDTTTLSFGALANTGVVTGTTTSLSGSALTNAGGEIGATGALTVSVADTDNGFGRIVGGEPGVALTATQLRNDGGTLGGPGAVTITATDVENGAGTIAAGTDLAISTARLTNGADSAIWADGTAVVTATERVTNRGSIAADDRLSLTTPVLDNGAGDDAGTLASNGALDLDFQSGSIGRTVSGGDLTLALAGDYATEAGQSVVSLGTLSLQLGGSLSNGGHIEGITGLSVQTGGDIANLATGEIVAPVLSLDAAGAVTNQGLINGGDVTVSGRNVLNEGLIYADRARIVGLDSITNQGSAAVIATRGGLLSLESAGAIANRDGAFLYSLGDLAITGVEGGQAASFDNSSATVNAAGTLVLDAGAVTNRRTTFVTEEQLRSSQDISQELRINKRNRRLREYTHSVSETAVTQDSGAGMIVATDIGIRAGTLTNDLSTISASNTLDVQATGGVTNSAFTGFTITADEGEELRQSRSCPLFGAFCNSWRTRERTPINDEMRDPLFTIGSVLTAGGTLSIDALTIDNLTPGTDTVGALDPATAGQATSATFAPAGAATDVTTGSSAGVAAVSLGTSPIGVDAVGIDRAVLGVEGAGTPEAQAAEFGFALAPLMGQATGAPGSRSLDLGGLFRFAGPGSTVLVESDPRFTSYGNFLSSDYFLSRLGFDPARTQQRLGDALYEQQLVQNQLVSQAGVGRLVGYASNDAQYRALLDAGVEVVQRFGLGLGIALSAEQMATLTTDVVILVETTVETAQGPRTVLAPRLYLTKVSSRDLTAGGAVIAGSEINLRAADALTNSGVIRASAGTSIQAGDILNTGRLDLGAVGRVSAAGDLVNRAGTITGGDVALVAGRDLTLDARADTSRTATAFDAVPGTRSFDTLTRTTNAGSLVQTTGDLALGAGRDLTISGSQVAVGGDLTAYAGGDIAIGSVLDSFASTSVGRDGKTSFDETQSGTINVLSGIDVAGDARFATPGAFTVDGATIEAGGALGVNAGSIGVSGVTDVVELSRSTLRKSGGLLSSTKTTTNTDIRDETIVASTLSGNTVDLSSNTGTSILGSNVVASEGVTIASGGDITIGALAATDTESQTVRTKKSGLSLGGGGLFLGVAKSKTDTDTLAVTNTGSLIGSERGDVVVDAGGRLAITGSTVATTGNVALLGDSIAISNTTDIYESTTKSKSSSFGLSVGVQSPVLSGIDTVRRIGGIAADGEASDRTRVVAGLASGAAAYNAIDAIGTADGLNPSLTVSVGVSKSRSESATRDETVVGSSISGDNVALVARGGSDRAGSGTIDVVGSEITAAGDLLASAPGDITFSSAQETDTLASSNKSSGFTVGGTFGLKGGFSPSASINTSDGRAAGTDVTNVETLVSAGGTATIVNPDGTLNLRGAQLSGNRVVVDTGALNITSEQDTSLYRSKQNSAGLSVSASGIAGNLGRERMSGDFASVQEQSGIFAGDGGFDVTVAGATTLTGGTIASTAEAARNRLTTGSLSATDIENRERFSASSLNVGGGIGDIGKTTKGDPTVAGDRVPGVSLPGIGNVSASLPSAISASGKQGSTTASSVAPGTIAITGDDPASRAVAAAISRETADAGALTQRFDEAMRRDIEQGFAATRALTNEVGTFFANRGAEEKAAKDKVAAAKEELRTGQDSRGNMLTADDLARSQTVVTEQTKRAKDLNDTYGGGSAARLIATAITGAAGSNVSGGLTSLVRGAAANVLQGLAVTKVKRIADSLTDKDGNATAGSEGVRAALQAVVGCAGAAAGGSSCGSAATGAAASVVTNYLLTAFIDPKPEIDPKTSRPTDRSLEDQEARKNLVATLVAGIAAGSGLDVAAAVVAAQLETERNDLFGFTSCTTGPNCKGPTVDEWVKQPAIAAAIAALGLTRGDVDRCLMPGVQCGAGFDALAGLTPAAATQFGEYQAAIDALSPDARAALLASLQNSDPGDGSSALLSLLISPETAVNVAAGLAQLENSGIGRTITTLVAIDLAFKKGVLEQGRDTAVGLADLIGRTVRFGADTSALGDAGDAVADLYRTQFGQDLPPSLAAIVPSNLRGEQTAEYLGDLGDALATYAVTRASDPAKFKADALYVVNKYSDEFGAAYDKAVAEGTLPQFFGEISGRVAFEIATILLPTKAAKLGRVAEGVEDLADTTRQVDRAVDAAKADHSGGLGGDGPYSPQQVQADLEARYGQGGVASTTLPPSESRFPALAGTSQTLAGGERITFDSRGFPVFDDITIYQTRISMKAGDRAADLRAATRDLRSAIEQGRVDPTNFDPDQLAAIKSGLAQIPRFTWHHHQSRGTMQLVPRAAHDEVRHIGSVSLSKGGSK